jgi:tRNA-dihydrouridine synthase A
VDARIFDDSHPAPSREATVHSMIPYIKRELQQGSRLKHITRHMLGLFQGMPGARHWRRHLSENAPRGDAGIDIVIKALEKLSRAAGTESPKSNYTPRHG